MKALEESAAPAAAAAAAAPVIMMSTAPHEQTGGAPEEMHPSHKRPLSLTTEYDTTEDSKNFEDLSINAQISSFCDSNNQNNIYGNRDSSISAFSASAATSSSSDPGLDFKRARYREPSIYNEDESESEMDCSINNDKFSSEKCHTTTSSCYAEEIDEDKDDGRDDQRSYASAPPVLNFSSSTSYGTNNITKNSPNNLEQHSVRSSQTGGDCGSTDAVASVRHYSLRDLEDDDERPPLWLLLGGGTTDSRPNSTTVSICSVQTEVSESSYLPPSESAGVCGAAAGGSGSGSPTVRGVGFSPTYLYHGHHHHTASRNGRSLTQEMVHEEMDLLVHNWSLWHIRCLKGNSLGHVKGSNNPSVSKSQVQVARREVHRALRKSSSSAM